MSHQMTAVQTGTGLRFGPDEMSVLPTGAPVPRLGDLATSIDGAWHYLQEDTPRRDWLAILVPADDADPGGMWWFGFDTLDQARAATASWLLDQLIDRQRERTAEQVPA
jgi:hypothetical protein